MLFWTRSRNKQKRSAIRSRVRVGSRSARANQSPSSIPSIVIGWFFRFCFRLRQSSFHWITSDGVIRGVARKWERFDSSDSDSVELMTPLTTSFFACLWTFVSVHKHAKKELGQYPAILTSRLVNNPYLYEENGFSQNLKKKNYDLKL